MNGLTIIVALLTAHILTSCGRADGGLQRVPPKTEFYYSGKCECRCDEERYEQESYQYED